jgi:agmatinase
VSSSSPVGPTDSARFPRYAGPATFGRLPRVDQVERCDVAVVGLPFDSGVSFRPGARFGPGAIREASRLLRPYNPALGLAPFGVQQVADAGDLAINPFSIPEALATIEDEISSMLAGGIRVVALGGDHTVALPMLRAVHRTFGRVALLHFDAHLDTWDTYFGAPYTHGTPFRRAFEEELLDLDALTHIGVRGPLYARQDLVDDANMGFAIVTAKDVAQHGVDLIVEEVRARIGERPLYVSVDIDVLDPAHAPGTGTPEAGGLTSRELLQLLDGLRGLPIVSADVVEVSPAYDHAEITAIAAAHIAYALVSLMGLPSQPEPHRLRAGRNADADYETVVDKGARPGDAVAEAEPRNNDREAG